MPDMSVQPYLCTISYSSSTDSHYNFFFPELLLHLMPILPSSHYFFFFFWLLNGKGHSYEAWGSCHQNERLEFWLEWTISINSLSGKVETFFYFSYFCLRPACGPEKLAVADENLTWWHGVTNFTRMLYEVLRPECLLAEGKKVFFPWELLAVHGSAASIPGSGNHCATLAAPLSSSRALRWSPLP